jgi:hypothetical protein
MRLPGLHPVLMSASETQGRDKMTVQVATDTDGYRYRFEMPGYGPMTAESTEQAKDLAAVISSHWHGDEPSEDQLQVIVSRAIVADGEAVGLAHDDDRVTIAVTAVPIIS